MNTIKQTLWLFACLFILSACDSGSSSNDKPEVNEPMSIFDIASSSDDIETLTAALEATGLDATLSDMNGTFTVFAPTDDAFALLGEDTISALLQDTDTLSDILLYHVLSGEVGSSAAVAAAGTTVETVNGASVGLSLSGDDLLVNLATVTSVDIMADNGVIHVIDAVLIPPTEKGTPSASIADTAVAAGNFTTLVEALQAADLVSLLADESETFTVFAPTDEAFAKIDSGTLNAILADTDLLTALLTQHVIAGAEVTSVDAYAANGTNVTTASTAEIPVAIVDSALTVGNATVTTADVYASNGVIHVIDTVIVGDLELPTPPQSIVDVAVDNGSFTTLTAALQATGLDATLADLDGTFTVFAPTDDAFAALGEETINALLSDTDTLSDILLYHVIADAEILSDAAVGVANSDDPLVEMANMDNMALSVNDGSLFVNLAKVTAADVMAANGVIHVVDKVILPPSDDAPSADNIVETAVAAGSFNTLVTALQTAGLDGTLADEDATFTVFAPTDAAFDKLGQETINSLLADVPTLTQVLLHHVVAAEVDSLTAFTLNGTSANSAADLPLMIEIVDGQLTVEGSAITTYDIKTSNGIIHVIDTVITSSLD